MPRKLTALVVSLLDRAATLLPKRDEPEHLVTGRRGEEDAYFYLRKHGYTIIARNYRSKRLRGEIDLIGWDGDALCFVEVKTRTTRDVKPAEAAVDDLKRHELGMMAREYFRRMQRTRRSDGLKVEPGHVRFDIVSVYRDVPGAPPDINLFKNAFSWRKMK